MDDSTQTTSDEAPTRREKDVAPQLIAAFDAEQPLADRARHLLAGLDRVDLARAGRRDAERDGRVLRLAFPDRAMSQAHAALHRIGPDRWAVEDTGSKNGVHVNGERVTRATLLDGDLVEIGRSLFVFRDAVAPVRPEVADLEGVESFSAAAHAVHDTVARLAPTRVSVVVHGQSGTGKELVARTLHARSGRSGPFVAVNCGGLPHGLVEAALFGHRKGAFSGAVDDRPGFARAADGGTLFLDEIGDLPLSAQAALLRFLQEREVVPIGETRPVHVDVRVVCATHRDLDELVASGAFRADLLARLAGSTLRLPRLADRREDLGILTRALLTRLRAPATTFTRAAARALFAHDWPLNVRELEKCLEAAVALAGQDAIDVPHLPPALRDPPAVATADLSTTDRRQREELVALLREHDGNVSAVARALGKGRMQIHRYLRRFGLEANSYRR